MTPNRNLICLRQLVEADNNLQQACKTSFVPAVVCQCGPYPYAHPSVEVLRRISICQACARISARSCKRTHPPIVPLDITGRQESGGRCPLTRDRPQERLNPWAHGTVAKKGIVNEAVKRFGPKRVLANSNSNRLPFYFLYFLPASPDCCNQGSSTVLPAPRSRRLSAASNRLPRRSRPRIRPLRDSSMSSEWRASVKLVHKRTSCSSRSLFRLLSCLYDIHGLLIRL